MIIICEEMKRKDCRNRCTGVGRKEEEKRKVRTGREGKKVKTKITRKQEIRKRGEEESDGICEEERRKPSKTKRK